MSSVRRLLSFLTPGNPLVNGFATGKAFFHAVPEFDLLFAILPAQQDDFIFHQAGKIQQPNIKILHLHANGVDLRNRVLDILQRLVPFCATPRHSRHINKKTSAEQDAVLQVLKILVYLLNPLFTVHGALQQRFQYRQQNLSLFKSKSLRFGHSCYAVLITPSSRTEGNLRQHFSNRASTARTKARQSLFAEFPTQSPACGPAPRATSASPLPEPVSD